LVEFGEGAASAIDRYAIGQTYMGVDAKTSSGRETPDSDACWQGTLKRRTSVFDNKFSVYHDELDLTCFNLEVPKPDAQVDIGLALKEYRRDVENIHFVYSNNAVQSLEINWRILLNHRDWMRFFSVRHPNEAERCRATRSLHKLDASIERITEKARSCLQRRLRS